MKSLSPTNAGSLGLFKRCDLRLVLLLAALVLLFAAQALAQEATIVGTVTDPSGAAVPNVSHHRHKHRHRSYPSADHQRRWSVCRSRIFASVTTR